MRAENLWLDDDLEPGGASQLNLPFLQAVRRTSDPTHTDVEVAIALGSLLQEQFERYGTDSSEEISDREAREAMRTLSAVATRIGVPFAPSFRDLSGFRAFWSSHGGYGSWAARRTMVHDLFGPLLEELERREDDALQGELSEPISPKRSTGWPAVDEEIAELRRHFHSARTPQDYRNIGNDVVAVLEALGAAAYDPARHLLKGEIEPPVAHTKNRLTRVVEVDFKAEGSDELVRLGKASVEVAQAVKHNAAGSRVRAGIAADAVIQLANMIRRLQDRD